MRITQGFVAVTKDAKYVHTYMRSTHVGHRTEVQYVEDIENATVFVQPSGPRGAVLGDVTWVPVEVKRDVYITGYGVVK